ncbi:MAG: dihydropteroate synthase [Lachnospiraceae bacterium]|nr:dihydropteroate synthase [Lachnospiraceae bacterium]
MNIRDRLFETEKHTYIYAILNVTPDSFSDGGKSYKTCDAVENAKRLIDSGADILDIGGESTRPGFTEVDEVEEAERVVPVIEEIRRFSDIPISIDTRKAYVARAAVIAGADIINDVSGLRFDSEMGKVIASTGSFCCLMHDGRFFEKKDPYIDGVVSDLLEIVKDATKSGIAREKIILDPGVGFGKNKDENLEIIREIKRFTTLGFPVLLGCSRKSVIGAVTGLNVNERLEGTLATTAMAVMSGVTFVRVHDAMENARFVTMMEAIRG